MPLHGAGGARLRPLVPLRMACVCDLDVHRQAHFALSLKDGNDEFPMSGLVGAGPFCHVCQRIKTRRSAENAIEGSMGNQTIYFKNQPRIVATSTIAGPKECRGIIGRYVETALSDDMYGESTYEKAECKMLSTVIDGAISNAGLDRNEVDMIVSGDLLNQIISASFAARDFSVPFLGVYGACSTMAESLAVSAAFVDGGYIRRAVAATGSHFASAERQYRYPLELGCTRPPQSQWTVTGAGAALVTGEGDGVRITSATLGKVVDYGVTDVNNMGAAMAPNRDILDP